MTNLEDSMNNSHINFNRNASPGGYFTKSSMFVSTQASFFRRKRNIPLMMHKNIPAFDRSYNYNKLNLP